MQRVDKKTDPLDRDEQIGIDRHDTTKLRPGMLQRGRIMALETGGLTGGAAGMVMAYQLAARG